MVSRRGIFTLRVTFSKATLTVMTLSRLLLLLVAMTHSCDEVS